MDEDLKAKLRKYVRPDQPFGPENSSAVRDPECAAALYDWNNQAFAELLTGSDIVVGRRGSGKSSLLRTFIGRSYLTRDFQSAEAKEFRDKHHIPSKTLNALPDFVFEANTPNVIFELEKYCAEQKVLPPPEIVAEAWKARIWWIVGDGIRRTNKHLWNSIDERARAYVTCEDLITSLTASKPSPAALSPQDYIEYMDGFLSKQNLKIIVTFDNIEQHTFHATQNAVISGLISATGDLIAERVSGVDVKLCLPAELFDELKAIAFRPDKDLQRIQFLHWNAAELLHMAARRLLIYLQMYREDEYDIVRDVKISDRTALLSFWRRYLPERITNSFGAEEETISYILRHTQLLPRHLICVLNHISTRYSKKTGNQALFDRRFNSEEIVKGIEDSEDVCSTAVLKMFRPVFPEVTTLLRVVLPRLRREFSYGDLQSVWQSSARGLMEAMNRHTFIDFWRLLLSIGVIGIKQDDASSSVYSVARFEFNTKYTLVISDKDTMCVHPLFSRIFNLATDRVTPFVLPRGSDYYVDREHV